MNYNKNYSTLIFSTLFIFWTSFCQGQATISASIEHDGLQRDYILYVPENYNGQSNVPLLFNFHGYTSNASEQMFYGDFRKIADTAGFIIVHPEGTRDIAGNTHFNVGWGSSSIDDLGFTNALIDSIASEYSIDVKRIYSTGMSNGGFMSYLLACQLSNRIAAVASVTGSMSPAQFSACDPQRPVPVLEIHGTADGVVPYGGGSIAKSIDDVLEYWVSENNCGLLPIIDTLPDVNMTDQSTVIHYAYADGAQGARVEHFKIIGGGHTWPGNALGGPGTNYDINASVEVWKFFSQFDIDGAIISGIKQETIVDKTIVYPNPTIDNLNISTDQISAPYQLFSSTGILCARGYVDRGETILSMVDYPIGLYFLMIDNKVYKIMHAQ